LYVSLHRHNTYVADNFRDEKDIMLTGLVGDGTVLPPWIATNKKIPDDFESRFGFKSYIRILPNDRGQSVNMMIRYLDDLYCDGYLTADELVLLDRGPGSKRGNTQELTEKLDDWFRAHHIDYVLYPVGAGSIQSPNDVHFHSQLKLKMHKELGLQTVVTTESKLAAALNAYMAIEGQTIKRYFDACGITGGSPARKARKLLLGRIVVEDTRCEATQNVLRECRDAYNDWNRKVKYARDGVNRDDPLQELPGGDLDGDYWQYFAWQHPAGVEAE
jgi:hypothetical protein